MKSIENDSFQFILILVSTLIVGIFIEFVQARLQRLPQVGDLIRNMIGVMFFLFYLWPPRKVVFKKFLFLLQIATLLLVCSQMIPVVSAVVDDFYRRKQFPELSGFETPFEVERWQGKAGFELAREIKKSGRASMRVTLTTDKYSGAFLQDFPENWEDYRFFQFSVYNPSAEDLWVTCRIHDKMHTQSAQKYEDRFNRKYLIPNGWHTITISLGEIQKAPLNRHIDLRHVHGIGIYASQLPYPRVIYLDDVRLLR